MSTIPVRRLVALALLPLGAGCYGYVPLHAPTVGRAAAVRLELNTPADYPLGDITMNDVTEVDGEVVAMNDSTIVLSATRLAAGSGFQHAGEDATLRIPRSHIATIEVRRLSRARTALFVGGLVALGAIAGASMGGTAGGSGTSSTSGGASK